MLRGKIEISFSIYFKNNPYCSCIPSILFSAELFLCSNRGSGHVDN